MHYLFNSDDNPPEAGRGQVGDGCGLSGGGERLVRYGVHAKPQSREEAVSARNPKRSVLADRLLRPIR
jgi:hypothetical protein